MQYMHGANSKLFQLSSIDVMHWNVFRSENIYVRFEYRTQANTFLSHG